ncbi:MAG: UDP-3-O-(3-hydroxymyristoyl)glucosamine N-acyltransferase [Pseudomonadota bacterium]
MTGGGKTLGELAAWLQRESCGDENTRVTGCGTLRRAGTSDLSFLANARYRGDLEQCQAGIVILSPEDAAACPGPHILSPDPYLDYARAAALFDPRGDFAPGVHPSAVLGDNVVVDETSYIGPHTVIEDRVTVGAGVYVGPGCLVGERSVLGDGSRLVARVSLIGRVELGQRVLIHPGAVLGADGFGLARGPEGWVKVPQLGGVQIGDDCEIGCNTTIDCGALDDTVLEQDVRLDNQIQIGHNAHIGAHTLMVGCVAVAGSARIGKNCLIGGRAGFAGHIEVADGVTVTAMTMVTHDVKEPGGTYSSGIPFQSAAAWRRNVARLRNLDDLAKRVAKLEKKAK